jgi:hypothetical protein
VSKRGRDREELSTEDEENKRRRRQQVREILIVML